jgi:hypothetical protein
MVLGLKNDMVLERIRYDTWHYHGGFVKARQLHEERVAYRSKLHELVYFAPS